MVQKYPQTLIAYGLRKLTAQSRSVLPAVAQSLRFHSSSTPSSPHALSPEHDRAAESEWTAASLFDDLTASASASTSYRGHHKNAGENHQTWSTGDLERDDDDDPEKRRRRQRFHAATHLSSVVSNELRAEVARDSREGVAAIPPLAPPGWHVQHTPGTRLFVMSRFIPGRVRRGRHLAGTVTGAAAEGEEDEGLSGVEEARGPRFRSIHEEQQQRQHRVRGDTRSPRPNMQANDTRHRARADRGDVVRSDITLTLVASFRVRDLSLVDPDVSICEYSPFDVIVRKQAPHEYSHRYGTLRTLEGQSRIWNSERCLYLSLASVNSELRLRGVQFISQREAHVLEHKAFYGEGDPLFRELLARQAALVQRRHARRARSAAVPTSSSSGETGAVLGTASSLDEPTTHRQPLQAGLTPAQQTARATLTSSSAPHSYGADALLLREPGYVGSVARRMCYQGPYVSELSKEFQEALMQYAVSELGINSVLVEYVNQMLFFMEQEEYMGWLARLGHMAAAMKKDL